MTNIEKLLEKFPIYHSNYFKEKNFEGYLVDCIKFENNKNGHKKLINKANSLNANFGVFNKPEYTFVKGPFGSVNIIETITVDLYRKNIDK